VLSPGVGLLSPSQPLVRLWREQAPR
jgi:hypothetical protein